MIGRREFIGLLGGGAVAWPLTARAQQAGKLPTIGFLGSSTPQIASVWTTPFVQRLRELGWIEGRTVAVEYRWAEGRIARAVEIATEFVRLKVNVIVTSGTGNIEAAKNATSSIPIVFAVAGDPVATGLVTSLAQPGGNATGCHFSKTKLPKRGWNFCARLFPILIGWQFCSMSVMPRPCWRCARFRYWLRRLVSMSPYSKSGEWRTLHRPSRP